MVGRWNSPAQLNEGPKAETKQKEYALRLTRSGNCNVLAYFSSIRVLMVAMSYRPHSEGSLKADELCHLLVVKIGLPNIDTGDVPSIGTILAC